MHVGPEITNRTVGELLVLELRGEHDIASAPELRSAFEAALGEHPGVVADLTPASFIDSTVLGVLLGAREQARERGRGFAVLLQADGELAVRRIIEVTGLAPILPVHETVEAAAAAAAGTSA